MPRPTNAVSRRIRAASILAMLGLVTVSRSAIAQTGSGDATTQDAVRATELARRDALLAADTVALSRIVAGEFIEISRLGTVRTRADNLQEIAAGDLKLLTVKYESLIVRVFGDVAVLTGIADNTGLYHGNPFAGKIRYTRVFVRRDARWQAVTMQQTAIP